MIWISEIDIFSDVYVNFLKELKENGFNIVKWEDSWLESNEIPKYENEFVVFHGSLGVASKINKIANWNPGAFCTTENFACSAWYEKAEKWLIHDKYQITTLKHFVDNPTKYLSEIESNKEFFVRPDSPLKPFSGRVLQNTNISLNAFDYGFYFEDINLKIVVAPIKTIVKEWRYVVANKDVISGSAYLADGRKALPDNPGGEAWDFANEIASIFDAPDLFYILDICKTEDGLKLLEINPFSGADLYACNPQSIIKELKKLIK